jgi:hypothetical protein
VLDISLMFFRLWTWFFGGVRRWMDGWMDGWMNELTGLVGEDFGLQFGFWILLECRVQVTCLDLLCFVGISRHFLSR